MKSVKKDRTGHWESHQGKTAASEGHNTKHGFSWRTLPQQRSCVVTFRRSPNVPAATWLHYNGPCVPQCRLQRHLWKLLHVCVVLLLRCHTGCFHLGHYAATHMHAHILGQLHCGLRHAGNTHVHHCLCGLPCLLPPIRVSRRKL